MRKLNWGILIVTLLISVLALASAFDAHSKVDKLEERVAEMEMFVRALGGRSQLAAHSRG